MLHMINQKTTKMNIVKTLSIGAVLAGLVGVGVVAKMSPAEKVATKITNSTVTIPDFEVKDASGKLVNLKKFKGKKVLVNLWATWCGPCRREMPSINSLYKKVNGKAEFVMLSLDDDFNKAINYKSSQALDLPMYYPSGSLPSLFQVQGIPATFIFNEKGELIKSLEGSMNYDTPDFLNLLTK